MTATRTSVIGLDGPDARGVARAGGKAANLAALIDAGFAVPGGFCITTPAYAQAAASAGLDTVLDSHGPLGSRARAALLATPVPADVAASITAAYADLGADVPVAVRSSATAEDLPTASFAGQQDTYLNVVGPAAVLDAVRRCWASLWTDRAVSYRESVGIDHRCVQLAVVVQRMVDAQVAGVLFTADPVTGTRTRTVIDASPGLGEAVVSGIVNPDHIVVEGDGRIAEHRIGDKAVEVRALAGGGTEQIARAGGADRTALTDERIQRLVALGRQVEAHFGAPQDIEWAIDPAGTIQLTQSRAITTLYPLPPPSFAEPRVHFCASLAQGLTRPVTPMGISAFRVFATTAAELGFGRQITDPTAGPAALGVAGGRLFVDITPVLRNAMGRRMVARVLDVMETRSAEVLRQLFDDPRFAVAVRSPLPLLRQVLRVLVRFRVPPLLALSLLNPAAARRRVDRLAGRLRDRTAMPSHLPPVQRLDHVEQALRGVFPILPKVAPVAGAGLAMLGVAQKLAGPDMDTSTAHEVMRSLPHNTTTEMDLRLWALATRIRCDVDAAATLRTAAPADLAVRFGHGELPAVLQQGLAEFLREYGHRAVAEIDLGMPRWSDDPTQLLGMLANFLRLDDLALAPDVQFADGARAASATIAAVVAAARVRSRWRAVLVSFALRRMRELAGMREEHKDLLVRVLADVRTELAALGAGLAARGLLTTAEDVFFLDLPQLRSALGGADHRPAVVERREEYGRELRRRHVPRILLSDGTEPETLAAPRPTDGSLVGTPASAGRVTAAARVVLDPVGAHLEPGEILVAPSTDPGWTPLFLTAGGLVMEMGGPNSHGAVVAREYGIPAVVGVADATLRITTGEQLELDGAAGTVHPRTR